MSALSFGEVTAGSHHGGSRLSGKSHPAFFFLFFSPESCVTVYTSDGMWSWMAKRRYVKLNIRFQHPVAGQI